MENNVVKNMKLSECEEMIMKILWADEKDLDLVTVTQRAKERFGKEWKLQTVATFMTRLKGKGWIEIYRIGRYSHYHPLVSVEQYREKKIEEMFDLFPLMEISQKVLGIVELANRIAEKGENINTL